MPRRALVLIDVQNDYFPGGRWTLSGIDAAADNAAKLLAAARSAGNLVEHVRHEFPSADEPFFAPGSDGTMSHPKVRAAEGEPVVRKHHVISFRETDLKMWRGPQAGRRLEQGGPAAIFPGYRRPLRAMAGPVGGV
jgi:nicotinamidase-related amidase